MEYPKLITIQEYNYNYVFDENICRLWDILKDVHLNLKVFEEYKTDLVMLKGRNTYDVGNEFRITWKGFKVFRVKVESVHDTTYKKEILYSKNSINSNAIELKNHYILKNSTIDKKTLLIWHIIFKKDQDLLIEENFIKLFQEEMCRKLEKSLNTFIFRPLVNSESMIIRKERRLVWRMMCSLINRYFGKLPEIINYLRLTNKEGTRIIVNKYFGLNEKSIMEEIKEKNKLQNNDWVFELEMISSNCLPFQNLIILLKEISENSTFIIIKHFFKDFVCQQLLKYMIFDKIKFLQKLKKMENL